jgi:hypothetical protein
MSAARFAVLFAVALAGCTSRSIDYPACEARIPTPAPLLADPAFAPLKYSRLDQYDVRRGFGYAVWADSKFEFRLALDYLLVPRPGGKTEDDLCGYGMSLRFAVPAEEEDKRRLAAFARNVAGGLAMDPAAFDAQLAGVLASGDKFRARANAAGATVEAGLLPHPSRGDFFMVKLTWPKPAMGPKTPGG